MFTLRPFQIILLALFGGLALIGVIFFMFYQGSSFSGERVYGDEVIVWGTLDSSAFNRVFGEVVNGEKDFQVVRYVQKDPRTFDLEFLNAIAEGRSPDLVVLSSDSLVLHRSKLLAITYDTFSSRMFKDLYVDGAEIFALSDGIYGLPLAVDPLVMYWNRDILAGAGLSGPPQTWESLLNVTVPAITRVSTDRTVVQSTVAFGEYGNIRNAKEILSLLFLQSGTPIVTAADRGYTIMLRQSGNQTSLPPAEAALAFYTQFSNPSSVLYSWSRSLPEDRLQFTAGALGLYFGMGSEYRSIERGNPNLNFDMAEVPQDTSATARRTFGRFYAFAIPRAAGHPEGAYAAMRTLTEQKVSTALSQELGLAPVHREEINAGARDPYRQILYSAALIARGWLDPNPSASADVFRTMIEDVTSGRERVSEALSDAARRLELLF